MNCFRNVSTKFTSHEVSDLITCQSVLICCAKLECMRLRGFFFSQPISVRADHATLGPNSFLLPNSFLPSPGLRWRNCQTVMFPLFSLFLLSDRASEGEGRRERSPPWFGGSSYLPIDGRTDERAPAGWLVGKEEGGGWKEGVWRKM